MRPLRPSLVLLAACAALALLGSRPARAADDFPPVTDEEKAITSVPGEPNAPAVMLFRKGEFIMPGFGLRSSGMASSLRVQVRLKILTEEGKSNGEISLFHSDSGRLRGFHGRTVLPDGRVLPVPEDARFVRKTSRSRKTFTTAVAFPGVQVGAILDYEYELWFDSFFYYEPWYFAEGLPVRHSEIVYKIAPEVSVRSWSRGPAEVKLQSQTEKTPKGFVLRVWGENFASVPDDPYGPPFQNLATQMMLLPTGYSSPDGRDPLFESWPQTCKLIGEGYDDVRRRDGGVAKAARAMAGSGSPRDKVHALYRFLRDQVESDGYPEVAVDSEHAIGKVLSERKGTRAEKALLLQAMLEAVDVPSRLVWAASLDRGVIDLGLPNPAWFDTVLLRVELDGKPVFLDPSDRSLAPGHLRASYEGSPALLFDRKNPETITLPESPQDQNLRRAEIDLALDPKGRLAGTGTLRLTGQQAWEKIDSREEEAKKVQTWKEWLGKKLGDFQIADVKVAESSDDETVTVTWSLAQREEEVLGDEASLIPSAPVGPMKQPFVQTAATRRSGVIFDYLSRDEVELKLRWPEGWKVESRPQEINVAAGKSASLATSLELHPEERTLVYRRRVDLGKRQLGSTQEYETVRNLFTEVEKNDAQKLVLAKH